MHNGHHILSATFYANLKSKNTIVRITMMNIIVLLITTACEQKPRAAKCETNETFVDGQCKPASDPNPGVVSTPPDQNLLTPTKPEPTPSELAECQVSTAQKGISKRDLYLRCLFDGKSSAECYNLSTCQVTLTKAECETEKARLKEILDKDSTWQCE